MQLNSFQKAKAVLVFNCVALFLLIVLTPFFIREGIPWAAEETVEGVFLAVEIMALVYFFRQYDRIVRKKEEEAWMLDVKLKSKEKELLNAFQYLGKVNVQISMIKSLLEKMKIPSTKNQLREIYSELLRLVCSITGKECAILRIIHIENGRTLSEQVEIMGTQEQCGEGMKCGNAEMVERFKTKDKSDFEENSLFYSEAENFFVKAFILVPNPKKSTYSSEERSFLEAVANQCEIIYLLFSSRYYKAE